MFPDNFQMHNGRIKIECDSWQNKGKSIEVNAYTGKVGKIMAKLGKATLIKVKGQDVYINNRSLSKRILIALGQEENTITAKAKDTAFKILFDKVAFSTMSAEIPLIVTDNLKELVSEELQSEKNKDVNFDSKHKLNVRIKQLKQQVEIFNRVFEKNNETQFNDSDISKLRHYDSQENAAFEKINPKNEQEREKYSLWVDVFEESFKKLQLSYDKMRENASQASQEDFEVCQTAFLFNCQLREAVPKSVYEDLAEVPTQDTEASPQGIDPKDNEYRFLSKNQMSLQQELEEGEDNNQ